MSKFALEGIRVVELTTGAAGPTVARVLGEFGAEVIRCETRLRGDGHLAAAARGRGHVAAGHPGAALRGDRQSRNAKA